MKRYTTEVYTSSSGTKEFGLFDEYGRIVDDGSPCRDGREARDFHLLLLKAQARGLRIVKANDALFSFTLEGA